MSPETDIVKWTFKDGTVLDVKLEEHSVSYVGFEVEGFFGDEKMGLLFGLLDKS